MTSFTKLFQTITASTIWCEDHATRIVWVTMLAMADRHGFVAASIPGLAAIARVSVGEVEVALAKFKAPDKYSRSKEHDGRRVADGDGGWFLLNYAKYREARDLEVRREQNRGHAANYRARKSQRERVTNDDGADYQPRSSQAEAEAAKTCAATRQEARQKLPPSKPQPAYTDDGLLTDDMAWLDTPDEREERERRQREIDRFDEMTGTRDGAAPPSRPRFGG